MKLIFSLTPKSPCLRSGLCPIICSTAHNVVLICDSWLCDSFGLHWLSLPHRYPKAPYQFCPNHSVLAIVKHGFSGLFFGWMSWKLSHRLILSTTWAASSSVFPVHKCPKNWPLFDSVLQLGWVLFCVSWTWISFVQTAYVTGERR